MTSLREPAQPPDAWAEAHTVWHVKASTFCNLRCSYCYEWERLSDPSSLPVAGWRRVFEAIRAYQRVRADRHGVESRVVVVWHGGEPLLLRPAYVRDVLELQREILGEAGGALRYTNGVQTNLTRQNETLELMCSSSFVFGVSLDGASGPRRDRRGRSIEPMVLANLERLLRRPLTCGVSLVLGRHNADALVNIYDRLDRLGAAWLRITPIVTPPAAAPGAGLELGADDVGSALFRLFEHWMARGRRLLVQPLARVLAAAERSLDRTRAETPDRRRIGERRLVVHPDGTFSASTGPGSPGTVLGNVLTDSVEGIVASAAADSLRVESGPCPVESRLLIRVGEHLRQRACDRLRVS